jgi:cell division protein FtsB
MLDFQQKRKLRSVAYSRVTLIILGLLVILSLRSIWMLYQKQQESEKLRQQANAEVGELLARQAELNTQIARLQTPQGIDAAIRDKYNVAKPDENMVVIVDDQSSTTEATTTAQSLWQKFLDMF